MKKRFSSLILAILCIVLVIETIYITTFPCTWGYSIYVDDVYIGSSKEQDQLLEILEDIKKPYITENTHSCVFSENIQIRKEKFLKEQLVNFTVEQITSKLTQNKQEAVIYRVRKGDTWSEIAEKHGYTSKELLALNPGMNINSLCVGDPLMVTHEIPFLSVVTIEQHTYFEDIPFQYIYWDSNNNIVDPESIDPFATLSRIVQPGVYGSAEVTANITYVNGAETDREILSSTTLATPIDEIRQILNLPS